MTIFDGFWLWVGKTLAELAMFVAVVAAIGIGIFGLAFVKLYIINPIKRRLRPQDGKESDRG